MQGKIAALLIVENCMFKRWALPLVAIITLGLSACATSTNPDNFAQAKVNFAEQNYFDAYQQLLVPAAKGNADAEYALGYLYYYGKGTAVNHDLGKQWILKSAQQGNEQAKQAYQMIMAREQGIMPAEAAATPAVYHPARLAAHKRKTKLVRHHSGVNTATTHAEKALLAAPKSNYTVQLLAGPNSAYAAKFITKNKLGKNARYFHRQLNGKDFYVVVYGLYATQARANAAVSQLPSKIQKLKPWVRRLASVQHEIVALKRQ
jgi:hypothetical protein